MLTTKTLLLLIFVNIILTLMFLPVQPRISFERFWNLDLSETDVILADKYSKFGPTPRTPSCMQRSYLLSIDFKQGSIRLVI